MTESMDQTAAANQSQCDELAAAVLAYCETNHFKIAAAESLTGGLLADAFVRVPGASKVFLGSAVTYDIRAKASILGVDAELLRSEGAVHPEVARQMAAERRGCIGSRGMATALLDCRPREWRGLDLMEINRQVLHMSVVPCRRGSEVFALGEPEAFELRLQGDRESVRRGVVHCILQKLRELSADSQE